MGLASPSALYKGSKVAWWLPVRTRGRKFTATDLHTCREWDFTTMLFYPKHRAI